MPKKMIESEVRPYLNLLIENGASLPWLQKFYKKNIKYKTIEATNALSADTLVEQIRLLRLFINNQAIYDKKAYEKLIAIRKLFRHIDMLADDLQKELIKQILINPNQSVNSFLAQDTDKMLNALLRLQVLLEIREQIQKVKRQNPPKYKKIFEEQESWLNKEIHSRVPIKQRINKTDEPLKPISKNKWDIQKEGGGYGTGPDGLWYFFNGESKFSLFIQREILKFVALILDFNYLATELSNRKKSFIELLIHVIKTNLIFGFMLISLAFFPYRLLRTAMAEFNQFIYFTLRNFYEFFFPKKHCNKPVLHFASLGVQGIVYFNFLLTVGIPLSIVFPLLMISPILLVSAVSMLFVTYNSSALVFAIGKYFFGSMFKHEMVKRTENPQGLQNKEAIQHEKTNIFKKNSVYTPHLRQLKINQSKSMLRQPAYDCTQSRTTIKP